MDKTYTQDYKKAKVDFENEMDDINKKFSESAWNERYFRNQSINSILSLGFGLFIIPFFVFIIIIMIVSTGTHSPWLIDLSITIGLIFLVICLFIISPLINRHYLKNHKFYEIHKNDSYIDKNKHWLKYKVEEVFYEYKYKLFQELSKYCDYNSKIIEELTDKFNLQPKDSENINNTNIKEKIKEKEDLLKEQAKRIEAINLIKNYHYQTFFQYFVSGFFASTFVLMYKVLATVSVNVNIDNSPEYVTMKIFYMVFWLIIGPLCAIIYYIFNYKIDKQIFDYCNTELKNPIIIEKKSDIYSMLELEKGIAEDISKELIVLYKKLYDI